MASLREIRTRIKSVKNIQQITRAMKMVASARLRQAQVDLMESRPYAYKMTEMVRGIAATSDTVHPLMQVNKTEKMAKLVLTSDKGLCAGFNAGPLQTACRFDAGYANHDAVDYLCIGRKGLDFFRRSGIKLSKEWAGFWQDLSWYHADSIADEIIQAYIDGKWSKVKLVYNRFKSAMSQETVEEVLLPLSKKVEKSQEKEIVLKHEFEPSIENVYDFLLPRYVKITIWHALLESKAAELAAKMQAMDNATESAGEMIDDMTMQMNRARQAAITSEISELVGSAEAINA